MSCSKMIANKVRGSATSSRRVPDTRDYFATILPGILSGDIGALVDGGEESVEG